MWSSLKREIIKKLGGYQTIDDAIEAIEKKDGKEKNKILTLAVKRLFNTISSDDILQEVQGEWLFKGKPLSEGERKLLIAEATQFLGTKLWQILQADVKYQANKKMYTQAENEIQLTAGKLWVYTFDALKTRLKSMSQGSGLFNNK